MRFTNIVNKEQMQLLEDSELHDLTMLCHMETIRRHGHGPAGPSGPAGAVKNLLIERYGIDGRKQTGKDLLEEGYIEPSAKYLLDEIPFAMSFDEALGYFSYAPTGEHASEIRKLFASNQGTALIADCDKFEILIQPRLEYYSQVIIRVSQVGQEPVDFLYPRPLKWFVEWYCGVDADIKRREQFVPIYLRPVVFGEGAQLLTEFDGKDITQQYTVRGQTYLIAPVLVNKPIDLNAASTLGALIRDGVLTSHCEPGKQMAVKSIYLNVGGHLVRMMTNKLPRASFCPAINPTTGNMVLDLTATTHLKKSDTDAFDESYEFMTLVNDDDQIAIEVRIHGSYNLQTGELAFSAAPVRITANGGTRSQILCSLLHEQVRVLAVEPVGDIVQY